MDPSNLTPINSLFQELLHLLNLGEMADKLVSHGLTDFLGHQALYFGNPKYNIRRQDCHTEQGIQAKDQLIKTLKKALKIKEVCMYIHLVTYIVSEDLPECVEKIRR